MASYALIIGADAYWTPEASLQGAVRDALEVYDWVTHPDGGGVSERNTTLLLTPGEHSPEIPAGLANGTAGNDVIAAGAGNDTVTSQAGNDRVCGDAGNDSINTAAGADFVLGGSGADTIRGGTENDILVGNPGAGSNDDAGDFILGDAGDDSLDGWFGSPAHWA